MSQDHHLAALRAQTPLNNYRIQSVLGIGGFGITYRATEGFTNRQVAIKEYLPTSLAGRDSAGALVRPLSDGAREDFEWGLVRFREEAKLLIGLKHHNIVPVLSYFEANATGYLVMEFQEGLSLGNIVAKSKLSEAEVLEVLDPLLSGLEEVHRRGILHRDIKPDNIFIREDGSPVLLDFGAARQALGQHSQSLTAIFTEGYAPYEQYDSDGHQGPWTDIYALGAVMYRCLLGKKPAGASKRVDARMRGAPDPLSGEFERLRKLISPSTAAAIERALGVRAEDRPKSIADFRELVWPTEAETVAPPAAKKEFSERDRIDSVSVFRDIAAPRASRRLYVRAALAIVVVAAATAGILAFREEGSPSPRNTETAQPPPAQRPPEQPPGAQPPTPPSGEPPGAPPPPQSVYANRIVGTWRSSQSLTYQFLANGTFLREALSPGPSGGTYRLVGKILELNYSDGTRKIEYTIDMPSNDRLIFLLPNAQPPNRFEFRRSN